MTGGDLKLLLDTEVERINRPEFIAADPVQFPRMYSELPDIEIAALLASGIAWGNRKMICRDASRMLTEVMGNAPHRFVMEEAYEDLEPDMNLHRTLFARNLQHFLRGLRQIYSKYPSLDAFSKAINVGEQKAPAWHLVEKINAITAEANAGRTDSRLLPQNLKNTALKRVNMALRWLVRDDGIVDLGVWKSIPKEKLYIPLDVHVGNISRRLGLLTRKQDDRKAVEELTDRLRKFDPADPCKYDYALFGIGIEMSRNKNA